MIFKNINQSEPYIKFKNLFDKANSHGQKDIQSISISSYSKLKKEVDSRFVNLKILDGRKFIFFTNYNSPKAIQFEDHPQISVAIYWEKIKTQIRIKGHIYKLNEEYSDNIFKLRNQNKNALAISSNQSEEISSYEEVNSRYLSILESGDLKKRPNYWGGYYFIPYSFEFWKGNKNRINKRVHYLLRENDWNKTILQP